jgi:hypothetical protein
MQSDQHNIPTGRIPQGCFFKRLSETGWKIPPRWTRQDSDHKEFLVSRQLATDDDTACMIVIYQSLILQALYMFGRLLVVGRLDYSKASPLPRAAFIVLVFDCH